MLPNSSLVTLEKQGHGLGKNSEAVAGPAVSFVEGLVANADGRKAMDERRARPAANKAKARRKC